ncbi:MAG TPA: nuclear transport factor 2 family protein [Kofleriaceae bacterium]|jgi:ketosteroid isomerase-like protein|nr:nuclear transport factor 2 family protein [Kofleriaceae bacterium]
MGDRENRATLERHWTASEAGDYQVEHDLYQDDAALEYPQSGERIRGRPNIQAARALHPAKRHFRIDRILGGGDLWVTEYVITYDGKPLNTVSIMEFHEGKVTRETQYFAEPFEPPAYRAGFVERSDSHTGWR